MEHTCNRHVCVCLGLKGLWFWRHVIHRFAVFGRSPAGGSQNQKNGHDILFFKCTPPLSPRLKLH